jgi:putative oxidoreductase
VSTTAGIIILIGRILFVLFPGYQSGIKGHIRKSQYLVGYAKSAHLPMPVIGGWPSGVWLVAASLSIALGIWPDIGSLMLGLFVIIAGAYFHRYWEIDDQSQRQMQSSLFWRNVIILGACLMMFGFFASVGDALRFSITDSLINLQ